MRRRIDRDYLQTVAPHIQVVPPAESLSRQNAYQQLVTAITGQRVVRLSYRAAVSGEVTTRDVEPIGLYLSQQWHLVGFCRVRQAFHNFRLDRIQDLFLQAEAFPARSETLAQYWAQEAIRRGRKKVVIYFQATAVLAESAQRLHDTKHQYGWAYEQQLPNGQLEMTFFIGSMPYIAAWLLPYAGAVMVIEPAELLQELAELARRAHSFFAPA